MNFSLFISAFCFLLCALSATATQVEFPLRSFFHGANYSRGITITAVNPYLTDGTNIFAGSFFPLTPSGGTNPIIELVPNDYTITFADVRKPLRFGVYATNGVVNVLTLITNGLQTYNFPIVTIPPQVVTNHQPVVVLGDGYFDNLWTVTASQATVPLYDDFNPGITNTYAFIGFTVAYTGTASEEKANTSGAYTYTNAYHGIAGGSRPAFWRVIPGVTNAFVWDDGSPAFKLNSAVPVYGADLQAALTAFNPELYITNFVHAMVTNTVLVGASDISATASNNILAEAAAAAYPRVGNPSNFVDDVALRNASNSIVLGDDPAWYVFGAPFYGGQDSFPPNGTEQSGHLVGTVDGINWTGGDSYPEFTGTNGIMRDIAGLRVGTSNYWTWTTSITVSNTAGRVPLWVSTNMHAQTTGWLLTNVDFSMNGDSNRIAYCWSPTLTRYVSSAGDTNILMTASVCTNLAYVYAVGTTNYQFEQRATIWNITNFPYGSHSAVEKINMGIGVGNGGLTNCLDLTPSYDAAGGILYFGAKDERSGFLVLGKFTTNTAGSLATTNIMKGDHSGWGAGREGVFFLRMQDGSLNIYFQRYDYDYSGTPGHGHCYVFAKSTAATNSGYLGPWSKLTNCNFAFQNPSSFKPIFLDTAKARNEAAAIAGTTTKKRGMQWVAGRLGAGTNGVTGSGDFSLQTNDWGGFGVGTEIEPKGGFGVTSNGVTHFFSYDPGFFSQLLELDLHSNVKETHAVSNTGVAFYVPVTAPIYYFSTNAFSLFSVTNGQPSRGAALCWSNTVLTSVIWINGTVTYKQIAP